MELDKAYLDNIKLGKIRHPYYNKAIEHARDMGVHVEGETPEHLLNITRPNEQSEIKEYRLATYQPVTQSLSEKVVNTVNKIFNPRLWSFEFEDQGDKDTLAQYLTEDYPFYRSIMNFVTETFTTKDFSDPNGAIVVMPQSFDINETEFFEPVATVYTSESLVDYGDNYYTFLFGDVVKVFTTTDITYYRNVKDKWDITFEYVHDFGFIPVFRLGGIIKGKQEPFYYESWIRGVLPHWNQVVQLTSDLQAAYVNHLFMDKWEYESECQAEGCNAGMIKTEIKTGKDIDIADVACKTCKGTGKVSKSPYGIHTVNRDAINPDVPLPTPPAGYIDKPIGVVDKVEDRITKEEKRGLASVNMEIVQMVGTDQSGIAKTVDREDLNAFLSRYSRHVFEYVLPELIRNIAAWRYGVTVSDIDSILPSISQPKDFNILGLEQLSTEYKDATNAKVSDGYLQHIEKELVQTKFANNDDARKLNEALINLNPYPGKSVDDLLTLQNLSEEQWTIYKSIHLIELVNIAIENDNRFLDKPLKQQRVAIDELAKEAVGFEDEKNVIVTQPQSLPVEPVLEQEQELPEEVQETEIE